MSLAKEAAGLQRATEAAILVAPGRATDLRRAFVAYGAQERAFLDLSAIHLRESRDTAFLDPVSREHPVTTYRAEIEGLGQGVPQARRFSAADWFATSTDWIDQLRDIERNLQSVINETAAELENEVRSEMVWNGLTVGLALVVLAFQVIIAPSQSTRESELEDAPY